jgi:hypothetical protein
MNSPSPDYLRWQEHKKAQRRVWMRALRKKGKPSPSAALIENALAVTPCADCGQHFPAAALEFMKKDGTEKLPPPSKWKELSFERVSGFIKKSDILCAVCKRLRLCNSSSSKHSS